MGRINKSKKEALKRTSDSVETEPKKKLIGKLDLKTTNRTKQKGSAIVKLKKNDGLKTNLLKQIQSTDDKTVSNELNFIKRPQAPTRLSNTMLKSIINVANEATKKTDTKFKKTLKKTVKSKIKKAAWNKNIELIKNQIHQKQAKQKREKTAIVGDVQPMIESLLTTTGASSTTSDKNATKANKFNKKNTDALSELVTIKEKNATMAAIKSTRLENITKIREREMSKSIPRQSIRNKKSQEDLALFSELSVHKEFVSNPLETLKKHFK